MDASTRFDTQIVGALPVIVHYFERLHLGAINHARTILQTRRSNSHRCHG